MRRLLSFIHPPVYWSMKCESIHEYVDAIIYMLLVVGGVWRQGSDKIARASGGCEKKGRYIK